MIDVYKCVIEGFPYPYFIAAMMNQIDMENLVICHNKGVQTESFIKACKSEFQNFNETKSYSQESVEDHFDIHFCALRVDKGKVRYFENRAIVGKNVIYIHKR